MFCVAIRYGRISRTEVRYEAEFPLAINPYFNIHTEIINVSACGRESVRFSLGGDVYVCMCMCLSIGCVRARVRYCKAEPRYDYRAPVSPIPRSISRFGSRRSDFPGRIGINLPAFYNTIPARLTAGQRFITGDISERAAAKRRRLYGRRERAREIAGLSAHCRTVVYESSSPLVRSAEEIRAKIFSVRCSCRQRASHTLSFFSFPPKSPYNFISQRRALHARVSWRN